MTQFILQVFPVAIGGIAALLLACFILSIVDKK